VDAAAVEIRMTTDRVGEKIREILLNDWDPIGIAGIREAADEYDRYVAPIVQMVVAGNSISDLSKYLIRIETETMGLNGNHDRARSVAAKLRSIARETSVSS
jgi:hypothetical protein